jgi:GMP synthase (glutamine-hydrolysing)
MKTALALRHVAFEHLGTFETTLREQGYATSIIDVGREPLDASHIQNADLLVVLGGPLGVYDGGKFDWLTAELDIIARRIADDRPTLGICLGAQMIAHALGAKVYPGHAKEIGWSELTLAPDGRSSPLRHLNGVAVLHWHGDTFDLPRGATWLAETAIAPHQAFSINNGKVLALQFHVEQHMRGMERWLIGHTLELTTSGIDLHKLRADTERLGPGLERASRKLFDDWLDQVGVAAPRAAAPAS